MDFDRFVVIDTPTGQIDRRSPGFCSELVDSVVCIKQTDRAKTPRHIQRCQFFEAYDRAERKKPRKSVPCATIRNLALSFRTVCKTFDVLPTRVWARRH